MICVKHPEDAHWRHPENSPLTPGGQPGPWVCGICHPTPRVFTAVERYDAAVHGEVSVAPVAYRPPARRIGQGSTLDVREATALFEKWKAEEFGWVKAKILTVARQRGEYHADDMIGLELAQPNMIGAAVNALARAGFLEKLNREGRIEHRETRSKTSRRASYVWRLSARGRVLAEELKRGPMQGTERMPGPKRPGHWDGVISRDGTVVQGVLE